MRNGPISQGRSHRNIALVFFFSVVALLSPPDGDFTQCKILELNHHLEIDLPRRRRSKLTHLGQANNLQEMSTQMKSFDFFSSLPVTRILQKTARWGERKKKKTNSSSRCCSPPVAGDERTKKVLWILPLDLLIRIYPMDFVYLFSSLFLSFLTFWVALSLPRILSHDWLKLICKSEGRVYVQDEIFAVVSHNFPPLGWGSGLNNRCGRSNDGPAPVQSGFRQMRKNQSVGRGVVGRH